jgi:nitrite reductase/ring-hydroxylating ferredoxin subunit
MAKPDDTRAADRSADDWIRVGTLDELKAKGMAVVHGGACPLLVVHDRNNVFALDNRCPHLGFPLHRGSVEDGILTCHWHHARFDLASGGTFDLWADDVPTAAVELRDDGAVWVCRRTRYADGEDHWQNRLREGLQHDIGLVLAKAVLGLGGDRAGNGSLIRDTVLFGASHRDGWGVGLTVVTALGNLIPSLPEEETYLALFHGLRRVARDCDDVPRRRYRQPLAAGSAHPLPLLGRWLRHWTRVRHRDGAERTVLTAIAGGASPSELAALLLTAVTDRTFADGGHTLDFINKAFECLDIIGWQEAPLVLPTVVAQMVAARGGEELNAWRHPLDLVRLCEAASGELLELLAAGRAERGRWRSHTGLALQLLADDPEAIIGALAVALRGGATATDLGRALAYAAALRVAWFGTANEHSDWEAAHHTFTYCNALHQLLKRVTAEQPVELVSPELLRGVIHGAMRLYLIRFLNVPPARVPGESGDRLDDLPRDGEALTAEFLQALDRQGSVRDAGQLVARYLMLGHPADRLITTLARAVLREDADFHTYQMLEAGVRQYREWGATDEGRHIMIAVARYLAAHSPTERSQLQTAMVARRLSLGQALHETEADNGAGVPASLAP